MNMDLADIAQTPLQARIAQRLTVSTLTPGYYKPGQGMRDHAHRIVMAGDTPVIAVGPDNCAYSNKQAKALADSDTLKKALGILGIEGDLKNMVCAGDQIHWPATCAATVVKASGTIVEGRTMDNPVSGELNAIILLPVEQGQKLAALLCTDNELLHILDVWAPALPA